MDVLQCYCDHWEKLLTFFKNLSKISLNPTQYGSFRKQLSHSWGVGCSELLLFSVNIISMNMKGLHTYIPYHKALCTIFLWIPSPESFK